MRDELRCVECESVCILKQEYVRYNKVYIECGNCGHKGEQYTKTTIRAKIVECGTILDIDKRLPEIVESGGFFTEVSNSIEDFYFAARRVKE